MSVKPNQVQEFENVEEKVKKTNINKLITKVKREEKKEKRNITIIFAIISLLKYQFRLLGGYTLFV